MNPIEQAYQEGAQRAFLEKTAGKAGASAKILSALSSPTAKGLGTGALGGAALGGFIGGDPETALRYALLGGGIGAGAGYGLSKAPGLARRILEVAPTEKFTPGELKWIRRIGAGAGGFGGGLVGGGLSNITRKAEERKR